MHSSNNPPSLPGDNALSDAGGWLLVVAIALVPLLFWPATLPADSWVPTFQNPFEVPRQALVLVVIAPVAALLLARNWAQRTFARGPVLILLAIVAAGLIPHLRSGFDLHTAWRSLRFLAPIIVLVMAGAALMHPKFASRLHLALVLPAIPVLLIGVLRRELGIFSFLPDRPDVAISSTLGNSNALGEAFAPVFLAGLVFASRATTTLQRILLWTGTACALTLVVLSHSRGAQLAAAAGFALEAGLWLWSRRDDREVMRRALAGLLLFGVLAALFLGLPPGRGALDYLRSFWSTTAPTNAVRLSIWGGTSELVKETMPLGAGLGKFESAFLPHRRGAEWRLSGIDTRVDNPHQEFLWITSETGLLGGLAFLLLIVVAVLRATRPDDGLSDVMRGPQRALLLATVALVILSLVRAPLHHPSGVLVFATLIGSVAPRRVPTRPAAIDLAVVPFLGAFLVMSLLDLAEDAALGRAVTALNDVKGALSGGQLGGVAANLRVAGSQLRKVPTAILKDFDRSFRAALAAGELADLKDAVRNQVSPEACADLPDQADVEALLQEVLALCPNHPGATNQLALLFLKEGSTKRAVDLWTHATVALPEAPRFRHNLALLYQKHDQLGDALAWMEEEIRLKGAATDEDRIALASLALGLGRDEATFGRWLAPTAPNPESRNARPPATGPLADRRRALLLWIADHPHDPLALADLAQVDYKLGSEGTGSDDLLSEANRAYARSRVRFAAEALEQGGVSEAEVFLKLAVQKDGSFLDAQFLRAKVAARSRNQEQVLISLKAMLARAVKPEALRSWIAADADLAPLLRDGRLAELNIK